MGETGEIIHILLLFTHVVHRWRPLSILWTTNRTTTVTNFIKQNVPLEVINNTLQFLEEMESKYVDLSSYHSLGVLSLNLTPLQLAVCKHIFDWKQLLGKTLLEKNMKEVTRCRDRIEVSKIFCSGSELIF